LTYPHNLQYNHVSCFAARIKGETMKNKKNIVIGLVGIIVLAAILLLASGKKAKAQAKPSAPVLNFYGNVDAGVQSYDNGTETLIRAGEGGLSTSRLGFRGNSPDLGGIQFNFNLEGALKPQTGTLGSTTTTGQVFTREAWVGVSGSAGEVRLGTTDMSNAGEIDTLSWQFGNFTNFPVNGTAVEIGTDASNVIKYVSPVLNGLQLQAGYAGNSTSATTDAKSDITSGSVTYSAGAAKIGVGYATKKAATSVGETDAKSIGGSYDFGKVAVGAAYIYGDNSTTSTVKSTANVYSVRVPLDNNGLAAHAVYAMAKDGAQTTANEGTGYTLGLTKTFAPGASVYAAYSRVDNDANSTMYLNGMTAPSAGKDPSLVTVGINYAF
jgi:predicted porin